MGKIVSYNSMFLPTFRMFLKIVHGVQLTIIMRVLRFSHRCSGRIPSCGTRKCVTAISDCWHINFYAISESHTFHVSEILEFNNLNLWKCRFSNNGRDLCWESPGSNLGQRIDYSLLDPLVCPNSFRTNISRVKWNIPRPVPPQVHTIHGTHQTVILLEYE